MADVSVRPARGDDAPALGEVQALAWRAAYAGTLPPDVMAELDPADLAESWRGVLAATPSRHGVLAACAGADIVGFAAFGPSPDADLAPGRDAEISVLIVHPAQLRRGHASRLLAATVDRLRADGFGQVHLWSAGGEAPLHRFLAAAGWGADGATRSLDLRGDGEVVVAQARWHSDVSDPPSAP